MDFRSKQIAKQFWDDSRRRDYEKDAHHPLLKSYGYDFMSLDMEGFGDCVRLLDYQGWTYFCSDTFFADHLGTDPECVRLFFTNLKQDKGLIKSIVYGKEIQFDISDVQSFIASLYDINNIGHEVDGICIGLTKNKSMVKDVDIRSLVDPAYCYLTRPTTSHLTRDNRMLAHILLHAIIPQNGSLTTLSPLHLEILHCLNKRIKVNLPHLIISHMFHCNLNVKYHYPYGAFISLFMHRKFGITLSPKRDLTFQMYNKKSLINIFTKDESSNSWTFTPKSNAKKRTKTMDSPSSSSIRPNSSKPETDPSMDISLDERFEKLSHDIMGRIDERMDLMEIKMENKLDLIEKKIENHCGMIFEKIVAVEFDLNNRAHITNSRLEFLRGMGEHHGEILKDVQKSINEYY